MKERDIQTAILWGAGSLPATMIWRNTVGVAKQIRRDLSIGHIKYGVVGSADLMGIKRKELDVRTTTNPHGFQPHEAHKITPVGLAFAIEVKKPGKKQTKEQRAWQEAWEAMGGRYLLADDADVAVKWVRSL